MNSELKPVDPLDICHSMKSIFIVKHNLANEHLSTDIQMASEQEIKLRDIYNDSENGKVVINRNMKNEVEFKYGYRGIYKTAEAAKIGAAEVNRKHYNEILKDLDKLNQGIENLNKIKDLFINLRDVNLM